MSRLIDPEALVRGTSYCVGELLKESHLIPSYQRDFVWQEKHVRQLMKDFFSHYLRNTNNEEIRASVDPYFLGAIVVMPVEGNQHVKEVVDGQQRLTTLTCVAAVLQEFCSKIDDKEKKEGLTTQLASLVATYEAGSWRTPLRLSDAKTGKFFLDSCREKKHKKRIKYWEKDPVSKELLRNQRSPAASLVSAISTCEEEVREFIDKAKKPRRKKRIESFCRVILETVVLLRIYTKSQSTAYELFESLNYRGVALTQADLIKNELIGSATPEDRDRVIDNWIAVKNELDSLDTLGLPDFLHYSIISRSEHVKASKLFDRFKEMLRSGLSAKQISEDLVSDVDALSKLVRPDSAKWTPNTLTMLSDIRNVLGVKLAYPALISGYHKFGSDKNKFELFVRAIMNFCFRYMKVLEGDVGALSEHMCKVAEDVRAGSEIKDIREFLSKNASDGQFVDSFKTFGVANSKLSYFVVYYLELIMLKGTDPTPHGREQNLEHIMPRNPHKTHWSDALVLKKNDPDLFKEYLWRVGNLIPLPEDINKSIKNKGIAAKISDPKGGKSYDNCDLVSPKSLKKWLDSGEWTYRSISERQNDLAKHYAAKAWEL